MFRSILTILRGTVHVHVTIRRMVIVSTLSRYVAVFFCMCCCVVYLFASNAATTYTTQQHIQKNTATYRDKVETITIRRIVTCTGTIPLRMVNIDRNMSGI